MIDRLFHWLPGKPSVMRRDLIRASACFLVSWVALSVSTCDPVRSLVFILCLLIGSVFVCAPLLVLLWKFVLFWKRRVHHD